MNDSLKGRGFFALSVRARRLRKHAYRRHIAANTPITPVMPNLPRTRYVLHLALSSRIRSAEPRVVHTGPEGRECITSSNLRNPFNLDITWRV